MSAFWSLFWLGFIGYPLMFLLASLTQEKGNRIDPTHIWVYQGTQAKAKDASVREVWERQNPGKSWDKRQSGLFTGCAIILVIAYMILLIWLADKLFVLAEGNIVQRLLLQIGAPILGGVFMVVFVGIQSLAASKMKSSFFQLINIIVLGAMGIMVIGALVLTFLKVPLPISYYWIWALAGLSGLFLLLDPLVSKGKQKQAEKQQETAAQKGGQLEFWVLKLFDKAFYEGYERQAINSQLVDLFQGKSIGKDFFVTYLNQAVEKLRQGELIYLRGEREFFEITEALMLDMVSGSPMSISYSDIYAAKDEILQTLQTFYFYMVDISNDREIHPRIQSALKK